MFKSSNRVGGGSWLSAIAGAFLIYNSDFQFAADGDITVLFEMI
jgi:hypothetical protein